MLRCYCGSCRSPLHADDSHSESVSCLGKSHADAALVGSDCSHCENISLTSLLSQIAFFSESDSVPRTLPFSSPQGPVRKKQRGRGSQIPHASLSPHREVSPVLFSQPEKHPSARASNLVSFGGSDEELADDSMSLAASDAEELSGSAGQTGLMSSGLCIKISFLYSTKDERCSQSFSGLGLKKNEMGMMGFNGPHQRTKLGFIQRWKSLAVCQSTVNAKKTRI
ncbi:hypothetical protein G5714_014429 [Onychostoma macrolepis]|uniref:Uncharacterized protein n=1 Tax=Onychostoma macrolepis TaxID=369639 RepID=A0A7J6CCS3_9TELE|nr:hypothetical protein G5714_014429 [Onychostoma macrolepis]